MGKRSDDFISPLKPAEPYSRQKSDPTPAPPWLALFSAWSGLIVLIASVVFVFLPGSRHPRAELEHAEHFASADRFLPYPIYGCAVALFLGIIVIWQMRKLPRPLESGFQMQQIQARVGVALAIVGAIIIYTDVALRGPK